MSRIVVNDRADQAIIDAWYASIEEAGYTAMPAPPPPPAVHRYVAAERRRFTWQMVGDVAAMLALVAVLIAFLVAMPA